MWRFHRKTVRNSVSRINTDCFDWMCLVFSSYLKQSYIKGNLGRGFGDSTTPCILTWIDWFRLWREKLSDNPIGRTTVQLIPFVRILSALTEKPSDGEVCQKIPFVRYRHDVNAADIYTVILKRTYNLLLVFSASKYVVHGSNINSCKVIQTCGSAACVVNSIYYMRAKSHGLSSLSSCWERYVSQKP